MKIESFNCNTEDGFVRITFRGNYNREYIVQCHLANGQNKIVMSDHDHVSGLCGEINREAFKDFGENRCLTMIFNKAREKGLEVVE